MFPVMTLCKVVGKGYRRQYGKFQSPPLPEGCYLLVHVPGEGCTLMGGEVKAFAFLCGQTDVSHHDALQGSRNRL